MEHTTLVIGPLTIEGANLTPNELVAGLPSPFAALGFAKKLAMLAGMEAGETWDMQALPIMHAVHMSKGRLKPEFDNQGKGREDRFAKFGPVEIPETITGTLRISLVLRYPREHGLTPHHIARQLPRMRYGGGRLKMPESRGLEAFARVLEHPDFSSALDSLPPGWVIAPADPEQAGSELLWIDSAESLADFVDAIHPPTRTKGVTPLIPAQVGFVFHETPAQTEGRRGTRRPDLPHLYSSSVFGMAQALSTRSDLLKDGQFDHRFWRFCPCPDKRATMFSPHHLSCL